MVKVSCIKYGIEFKVSNHMIIKDAGEILASHGLKTGFDLIDLTKDAMT
jgi:hypothetical protein